MVAPDVPEPETLEHNMRILVADDHPTNLKVVELILAQIGAEVVQATNGREAILAFRTQPFDLVLMDMQMPVLDGLAAVRRIRQVEVATNSRPVPILMLTANAMPEHVEAGRRAGANGHVSKPITSASLIGAISELLDPDPDSDCASPLGLEGVEDGRCHSDVS